MVIFLFALLCHGLLSETNNVLIKENVKKSQPPTAQMMLSNDTD